jgi:hypothetical protein
MRTLTIIIALLATGAARAEPVRGNATDAAGRSYKPAALNGPECPHSGTFCPAPRPQLEIPALGGRHGPCSPSGKKEKHPWRFSLSYWS